MLPHPKLKHLPILLLVAMSACAAPSRLAQPDQQRITNRTYVITGASSGFGRGVATRLARYGANVVLAARRAAVLDQVAAEVTAAGGHALVVATDVTKPADVTRLAQAAIDRFGRIDVWINDAGVGAIGRFEQIPAEDQARVVDTNLNGTIYGSHAALRQFRRQGSGTLINVASVAGRVPLAYLAAYSASKFGVVGLDAALSQELRLDGLSGIHVVTIEPWVTDTPWFEHADNHSGHTPRLGPADSPKPVINAIVWASIHPGAETPVGFKAETATLGRQLLPALTDRLAGDTMRHEQFERAPPGPDTEGALYAPMPSGTGVEGGVRARMRAEDSQPRLQPVP